MKKSMAALALALALLSTMLAPSALAAKAVDIDTFYVRFEGDTNVRSGAGLDYKVIGTIGKGKTAAFAGEAEVDDRDVRWFLIDYEVDTGWVSSKYAVLTNGSYSPMLYEADWERAAYYKLKEKNVMRSEPSTKSEALSQLYPGDSATNLGYFYFDGSGNCWCYVIHSGEAGWIVDEGLVGVMY